MNKERVEKKDETKNKINEEKEVREKEVERDK